MGSTARKSVPMSTNSMDERECELRRRISDDIRLWAKEMRDYETPPDVPATIIGATPKERAYRRMCAVALLVEGGYRGNCSRYCDEGRHEGCKREGCVCECHRNMKDETL